MAVNSDGYNFEDLPNEILYNIVDEISPESATSLGQVSKFGLSLVNARKNKICDTFLKSGKAGEVCEDPTTPAEKWCQKKSGLCEKVVNRPDQIIISADGVATVPSGTVTVSRGAFSGNDEIIRVDFPNSVKYVEALAFLKCIKLREVNFPEVETIGLGAFMHCRLLSEVNIPMVKTIGKFAFSDCNALSEVNFPEVETIGGRAFWLSDSLKKVNLAPNSTWDPTAFLGTPSHKTMNKKQSLARNLI